jgi:transposase-like protein
MAKGVETSDEVKAAVISALLAGQGVSEVARSFQLPKSTVSRIRSSVAESKLEQVGTKRQERIGDLIAKYLSTALNTLSIQAEHAADKAWLNQQSASEVATLHGVIADKSLRILEAIEPEDESGYIN